MRVTLCRFGLVNERLQSFWLFYLCLEVFTEHLTSWFGWAHYDSVFDLTVVTFSSILFNKIV